MESDLISSRRETREKKKECDHMRELKETSKMKNAILTKRLMEFARMITEKKAALKAQQKRVDDLEKDVIPKLEEEKQAKQQIFKSQLQDLHNITVDKMQRLKTELNDMRQELISSQMDMSIVQETFQLIRGRPIAQSGQCGDTSYVMRLSMDEDMLMVDVSVSEQERIERQRRQS